ncbi:hypothetical protein MmiAt1_11650 [Methanimicrococcus sp. At1]|uniref:UPF0280 protein MmiAt1_11650 n=1 Tax=Methanimicrococcus hacksteinii TaxID=3028293 RepID=A0ABU3VQJ5_9EURY|nr:UPF0280 family protein [Methanimicrococcus sp. At1]MDV0445580.1 hypothetical protein [Methanimicrococcus sp. At1]
MYQKEVFQFKQTIVTILADNADLIEIAKAEILKSRSIIENYIFQNPFFEITLEAYEIDENAPPLIQRMIEAGNAFGIGPMSAVAGTIAEAAVLKMKESGASFALVDNGGDIAIYNTENKPTVVGVYAGNSTVQNLGFSIEPSDEIIGICTSSGTVGPSISFGKADAAIVFSKNVSLSDSAATALGNALKEGGAENIEKALPAVSNVEGIEGAVLIQGENIGMAGKIPKIVKANVDYDIITKG